MLTNEGRDVLVQAALRGHPQARSQFHDPRIEADCALGVLHLTLHASRIEATLCKDPFGELNMVYGADQNTRTKIIYMNDILGYDFLTIARKLENSNAAR